MHSVTFCGPGCHVLDSLYKIDKSRQIVLASWRKALSVRLFYRTRILRKVERNAAITRTRNPSVKGKTQESCSLSRSTGILPAPATACITRFYYAVNCSDCCVSLAISGSRSTRAPYLPAFLLPSLFYFVCTFEGIIHLMALKHDRIKQIDKISIGHFNRDKFVIRVLRVLLSIFSNSLAEICHHYFNYEIKRF